MSDTELTAAELEAKRLRKLEKKEKKEKKRLAKEAEEKTASATVVEEEQTSEKKDKKEKKEKKEKKRPREEDDDTTSAPEQKSKKTKSVDAEAVKAFRKEHNITVTGEGAAEFDPFLTFDQAELPEDIAKCCSGFAKPSPIQAQAWPALFKGKDVIGIAETGSGKTMGFVIPALQHLRNVVTKTVLKKKGTPSVLVLAPTRELAMQTQSVCDDCAKHVEFKSVCIYGGMEKWQQLKMVNDKINMVVATPGRLLSLLREGHIDLSQVTYFVLDEADRLLDMGFEADIREIAAAIKPRESRQTLLFSATWPETVQKFGHELVKPKYFRIDIGREPSLIQNEDGEMVVQADRLIANNRITQSVYVFDDDKPKRNKLRDLLKDIAKKNTKIIVFVLYRKEVPMVERFIRDQGLSVAALSSDYTQVDRTAALQRFKDGKATVLVATDVAARGLDIPNVEHVVNYSFPLTIEDYVHRIGRTGRAGKTGNAWTFFTAAADKNLAGSLQNLMRESGQEANIPDDLVKFGVTVKRKKEHGMYGSHFRDLGDKPMPVKKHIRFD